MQNDQNLHKPFAMLTMELFENRRKGSVGSSRIRGEWVAKHSQNIELYQMGINYQAMIYQKAYWFDHAQQFKGVKIFDLCDPDWLNGRQLVVAMINECDAVTVPTEALAEYIRKVTDRPVYVIPDRLDLSAFPARKQKHYGDLRTLAWYGYADNQKVLEPVIDPIHDAGCQLVVISDRNYLNADVNIRYNGETINDDLMQYDAVLNVKSSNDIRFGFKSNNKTVAAWALGLPVVSEYEDLAKFKSAEARNAEAEMRWQEVQKHYDVKQSARELESVIMELLQGRQGGNHV